MVSLLEMPPLLDIVMSPELEMVPSLMMPSPAGFGGIVMVPELLMMSLLSMPVPAEF